MLTNFFSVSLWMCSLMDPGGEVEEEALEEMVRNLEWWPARVRA